MSDLLGLDASGNGNNWTVNNLSITDQMLDSPTNNFATWNPLNVYSGARNYSEGNLRVINTSNGWRNTFGNQGMPSGKYYWEIYIDGTGSTDINIGITTDNWTRSGGGGAETVDAYSLYAPNDKTLSYTYSNSNNSGSGGAEAKGTAGTFGLGDITQIAYDADTGKLWYGKNGTWLFSGVPSTGTSPETTVDASDIGNMIPVVSTHWTSSGPLANFGQDSTFANNDTGSAGPYTDSGGIGDFFYEPPTDFLALCTKNLPEPTVVPSENFDTVTYTGSHTSDQDVTSSTITGVDFAWLKSKSNGTSHALYNSITGTKELSSDLIDAEVEGTNRGFGSFLSNGVELLGSNDGGNINQSPRTYVAWFWKAGGTANTFNIDGTGYSTASAAGLDSGDINPTGASVNTTAGFSIISYTGNSTSGSTLEHGLDKAPEMVIVKNRTCRYNGDGQWVIWHQGIGVDKYFYFTDGAAGTDSSYFFNAVPTSSVLELRNDRYVNGKLGGSVENDYIAYCFHSVEGYSKVGSYTGNGSSDGTFVHCGFAPAYIMVKVTNNNKHWTIYDTERDTYNVMDSTINANQSSAEYTDATYTAVDFLSNGFKWRQGDTSVNSAHNFIFIAFAKHPFKFSTAR